MTVTARLASVVLTLVMSGTPTLLLACAALCGPEMRHGDAAATPGAIAAPSADLPRTSHDHHDHHMPAAPDDGTTPVAVAAAIPTQLGGVDEACCPDATVVVATPLATGRLDALQWMAPALTAMPSCLLPRCPAPAPASRTNVVHPSPARPPLVLRV